MNIAFITAVSIVASIGAAWVIARFYLSSQFDKQIGRLFLLSPNPSAKTFKLTQLSGLPGPVQKYFRHVLKDGQRYINYVRLTHSGTFKTGLDKKWINITGEQYFTTVSPGFMWKGVTAMFTARDLYVGDNGRLLVWLFSMFKVVDGKGPSFNEGELQRWLAESVWFPTNLLPDERIAWEAVDENTARLNFNYKAIRVSFLVKFNIDGEILQMETKRYMDSQRKEIWICRMSDYEECHGMLIPMKCGASWKLDSGESPYARFTVTHIEYERPTKF